jgi:multidrug efflux pump subunit AcrA (membrane-fusion protein)
MSTFPLRAVVGALVVAGSIAVVGCGGRHDVTQAAPPPVSVSAVIEAPVTAYVEATGRTEAINFVTLKAQATGYLEKVMFEDGDFVKAGQQLYQIDDRTYVTSVKNAKATIKRTEATLAKANADIDRARKMGIGSAISREEYDQEVAKKQVAQASLDDNKATLENAELNLSYTKVMSPIDGIVSRTQITKGNLVTKDQTTLTTIVSVDPIYAYFDVDERTALRVQEIRRQEVSNKGLARAEEYLIEHKVGQEPRAKVMALLRGRVTPEVRKQIDELIEGSGARLPDPNWLTKEVLDKYPKYPDYRQKKFPVFLGTQIEKGFPHEGYIDFVETQLSASTGTLRVRGNFPNKDGVLQPNLFVRIRVPIGEAQPALLVSETAIVTQQDRKFVFVVDPETQVAEMRPVRLGVMRLGLRVIEDGVKKGEMVVVEGTQRVQPGAKVAPTTIAMPGYVPEKK